MDKEQARILFLILIAVLFIGQAVYDFIKRLRKQAAVNRRQPVSKRATVRMQPEPKRNTVSRPQPQAARTYRPEKTSTTATHAFQPLEEPAVHQFDSNAVPEAGDSRPDNVTADADDIRKAVIWSEILKRKF